MEFHFPVFLLLSEVEDSSIVWEEAKRRALALVARNGGEV